MAKSQKKESPAPDEGAGAELEKAEKPKSKKDRGIDPTGMSLEQIQAAIDARYGSKDAEGNVKPVIRQATATRSLEMDRIQTGIIGLDIVTGGGIPKRRVTRIAGPESSAKTTTVCITIAASQSECRECGKLWRYMDPREWLEYVAVPYWAARKGPHGQLYPVPDALWPANEPPPPGGYDRDLGAGLDKQAREVLRRKVFNARAKDFPVPPVYQKVPVLGEDGKPLMKDGKPVTQQVKQRACECKQPVPCRTFWLDSERALDNWWCWKVGMCPDWCIVVMPETAEMAGDTGDLLLRSGQIDNTVLDSVAMLIPKVEADGSMEDSNMAPQARAMGILLRKWVSALCEKGMDEQYPITIIMTNQERSSMQSYGAKTVNPGGNAQKFVVALDLRMFSGEVQEVSEGNQDKAGPECMPNYTNVRFIGAKNKTSTAKVRGGFKLYIKDGEGFRAGTVAKYDAMLKYAERVGVVVDHGDKASLRWEWVRGGIRTTSREKLMQAVRDEGKTLLFRTELLDRFFCRPQTVVPDPVVPVPRYPLPKEPPPAETEPPPPAAQEAALGEAQGV